MPGWYGFGSAVLRYLAEADKAPHPSRDPGKGLTLAPDLSAKLTESGKKRLALLQRMAREWPFFKALLSNMDMVIAKTDLGLAQKYAALSPDKAQAKKIFTRIEQELELSAAALSLLTGDKQRLAHNASLKRSIHHRFPYIDPLHHLQVELIKRNRSGELDERVARGIHLSINGIASGLRNTG